MLRVGRERDHERERDPVRVVVAQRVDHRVVEPAGRRRLDRRGVDDELDVDVTAASSGRAARRASRACRPRSVPGQDPAVDLDRRLARDDVVLHAGVDDVRADRVAEERPQDPRPDIGSQSGVEGAPPPSRGSSPARAATRRRWLAVERRSATPARKRSHRRRQAGRPWTARRVTIVAARTAALSSRGIEPWPHVPWTVIR